MTIADKLKSVYPRASVQGIAWFGRNLGEVIKDANVPLIEIMYSVDEFESTYPISVGESRFALVLSIAIDEMSVCKENAERLFEFFTEELKEEIVYKRLTGEYRAFLTEEQKRVIENVRGSF